MKGDTNPVQISNSAYSIIKVSSNDSIWKDQFFDGNNLVAAVDIKIQGNSGGGENRKLGEV